MRRIHWVWILSTAVSILCIAGEPFKIVQAPPEFAPVGRPSSLQGEKLIQLQSYSESSATTNVKVHDLQTGTTIEFNVWPEEPTAALLIKKVAPLRDGRFAVGMRAISWENHRAEIVAIFDKSGRRVSWFRTNPFAWDDLALDGDQTLWIFGHCPDYLRSECGTDSPTVRHYSLKGDLIEGFLPYSAFPGDSLYLLPSSKTFGSSVFTTRQSIRVYADMTSEWIELNRKGKILSRQKLIFPEDGYGLRLAMSESGRLVTMGSGLESPFEWSPKDQAFSRREDWTGRDILGSGDGWIALGSGEFGKPIRMRYYEFK